jgi:TATA-box binding protein (TBP) (component of TFIID and TFIIIB)
MAIVNRTAKCLTATEEYRLIDIARCLMNCEYKPHKFSGVIIRTRKPYKGLGLLFGKGKLICCSIHPIEVAISITNRLRKLGFHKAKITQAKIVNTVVSGRINRHIQLSTLRNSSYEGEIFPGALMKLDGATAVIFANGKYYITGKPTSINLAYKLEQILKDGGDW